MENKTAIVTAAGRGIGAAIARELAANGYTPILMSRSKDAIELAAELCGVGIAGSVTESGDLKSLVHTALEKTGRIDAVVNNTGHAPKGDLLELTDEDWQHGLDLLLLNVIRMARLVTPTLLTQGSGAFVNISTFSAFEPNLSFPVSSAFRAGLGSFTRMYAERYAADNIRMNSVLPGYVDSYPDSPEIRAQIPMERYGSVAELAQTVRFLLSDAAGYLTGQNIRVDGGLTRSV